MDSNAISARPDVTTVTTAPRPTPKPASTHFSEVLAKSVVSGAESVVRVLPGGPQMALALRGGGASIPLAPDAMAPMSFTRSVASPTIGGAGAAGTAAPEGPGGTAAGATSVGGLGLPTGAGTTGTGAPADGSMESALAQSQEMNIYFLQIQETVNAQNRSFTAMSNVLKTEHDTVKTAIGNVR
jgi:hypothetical protein